MPKVDQDLEFRYSMQGTSWVGRWSEAYQGLPEDRIPLLDTNDPEIPAQFV